MTTATETITEPAAEVAHHMHAPDDSRYSKTPASKLLSGVTIAKLISGPDARELGKLRSKPLASWPSDVLEDLIDFTKKTLDDHPEGGSWPYASATRHDIGVDFMWLSGAARLRPALKAAMSEARRQVELFPDVADAAPGATEQVLFVPIGEVEPDPHQPRTDADDELAESIKREGVLQPLIVRPHPDPEKVSAGVKYMIRYGERRHRGAVKAGRATIPVIVRVEDEGRVRRLIRQNVENTSKALKPLDEARNWLELQEATGWSDAGLARALSKDKSTVSDRLALAKAPPAFVPLFEKGVLSAAAAPIVRQYRDIPHSVLADVVRDAQNDWAWAQAIQHDRPVPLNQIKGTLDHLVYRVHMREMLPEVAAHYTGSAISIKGKRYATDVEAYKEVNSKMIAAAEKAARTSGRAPDKTPAPARNPDVDRYQREERAKVAAARKKSDQRKAQFVAIAARLERDDVSVDATVWGRFLARYVIEECTNDTLRAACKALGLEVKQGRYGASDFHAPLRRLASSLTGKQLPRFALLLLLAADIPVSAYSGSSAKRIAEAAEILKLNLAKVAGDPALPEKAKVVRDKARKAVKGKAKSRSRKGKK